MPIREVEDVGQGNANGAPSSRGGISMSGDMPWTSEHMKWLADNGRLTTGDGRTVTILEFLHQDNESTKGCDIIGFSLFSDAEDSPKDVLAIFTLFLTLAEVAQVESLNYRREFGSINIGLVYNTHQHIFL